MAAPSTAYLNNGSVLSIHIPGVIKLDALLALKLVEYGSNIKSIFYLDGLLILKKGTDIGFIGYVLEGSANYHHRSTSRLSKKTLQKGLQKFILLNDAGLNSKGDIGEILIISLNANLIKVSIVFNSARYLASQIRVNIEVYNNSATQLLKTLTILNTSLSEGIEMEVPAETPLLAGDVRNRFKVVAEIENGEGVYSKEYSYYPEILKQFYGAYIPQTYTSENANQVLIHVDTWANVSDKRYFYGNRDGDLVVNDRVQGTEAFQVVPFLTPGTYFLANGRFVSVYGGSTVSLAGWASTSQTISATVAIQRVGLRIARLTVTLANVNPKPYALDVTVAYSYTYFPSGSLDPVEGSDSITVSVGVGFSSGVAEKEYSHTINNLATTSPITAPIKGKVD